MKDYYKILGVNRQATQEEIKRAYRRLAKQYHPDVVKDDKAKQEQMYQIQEAYAHLGNEERRKKYDEENVKNIQGSMNTGREKQSSTQPYRERKTDGPFKPEDMFAAFFGTGNMREAVKRNASWKKI